MTIAIARLLLGSIVILAMTGCVQTQVTKAVQGHKDVNGRITGYTETETATQVGGAFRFGLEHLRGAPGEAQPMKLY